MLFDELSMKNAVSIDENQIPARGCQHGLIEYSVFSESFVLLADMPDGKWECVFPFMYKSSNRIGLVVFGDDDFQFSEALIFDGG